MKCTILHDLPGRLRVHLCCGRMTLSQADVLEYYLRAQDGVQDVRVYNRTQDAVVLYDAERGSVLRALAVFSFAKAEAMELVPEHTSRALTGSLRTSWLSPSCGGVSPNCSCLYPSPRRWRCSVP